MKIIGIQIIQSLYNECRILAKAKSLPCLKGSETADAVVNDNPVDCQSRGMTEPQRDGGPPKVVEG